MTMSRTPALPAMFVTGGVMSTATPGAPNVHGLAIGPRRSSWTALQAAPTKKPRPTTSARVTSVAYHRALVYRGPVQGSWLAVIGAIAGSSVATAQPAA